MKDLWLTYDVGNETKSFITILENCSVDTNKNGETVFKGGTEVPVTLGELRTIAKIFNDAIDAIERND